MFVSFVLGDVNLCQMGLPGFMHDLFRFWTAIFIRLANDDV